LIKKILLLYQTTLQQPPLLYFSGLRKVAVEKNGISRHLERKKKLKDKGWGVEVQGKLKGKDVISFSVSSSVLIF
jgi:hypothetical protein